MIKGELITEKFALLNILKTLQALTAKQEPAAKEESLKESEPPKSEKQPFYEAPNPMVGVLERHERISYRVRSSSPKKQ